MKLKLCTKCQRTFKKLTAPEPELTQVLEQSQQAAAL
jgi:hypothetical protein